MKTDIQEKIFTDWLQQYKSLLFKVVRAYAFTTTDQDDLFQEITLQIWKSIPRFKYQSAVTTWLYRIALNIAIKWTSKEKKHRNGQQDIENVPHILQEQSTPADERLDWLYQEIAQLNEIDRSLTLLLLDGFSYQEMSDILGISVSNVGVKINRIKKHLVKKSKNYSNYEI